MDEEKQCTECHQIKPLTCFTKTHHICKPCRNTREKEREAQKRARIQVRKDASEPVNITYDGITKKVCEQCVRKKVMTEFALIYKKGSRIITGRNAICRQCQIITNRQRRQERKEQQRVDIELSMSWDKRIESRYTYKRDRMLKRVYGISLSQYEQTLTLQGNVCAICHTPDAEGDPLHVDHCHRTGVVRGLLCKSCNFGLGMFNDDIERMESAISYLQAYKSWDISC